MSLNKNNITSSKEIIIKSISLLENYILKEKYHGYDPYDALKSPIFKYSFLNNRHFRLIIQRIIRRAPFNFRCILRIPKGYNPVTLGLSLQAFSYLAASFPENKIFYTEKIDFLLSELNRLSSKGYSGICWGYDFDWESRYSTFPAFTPTSVATGFIANALFENFKLFNNQTSLDYFKSSVNFIINDLNKIYDKYGNFCYSYSPLDKQVVFNASMKASRLLAQAYSIIKDKSLILEANKAIGFVMSHQRNDGAWIYSKGDSRKWVDNYHTAYILDCLKDYEFYTNDTTYQSNFELGLRYYLENFFSEGFIPKFYDKKIYPIDSTAVAQSIISLIKFGYLDKAIQVALWAIRNMQSSDGFFYFRKYKYYTIKISYMRWSNSWMLLALSYLLFKISEVK